MVRGAREGPYSRRRVKLKGAQQTLLITLYAKALDSRSRRPVLGDRKADEVARAIDYDFQGTALPGNSRAMVVRARQTDEWVRDYLRGEPGSVVLNLGCGLDSRASRISPSSGSSGSTATLRR